MNSPAQLATWLAGLLGIVSPKWVDGVLSGPGCVSGKRQFCPQQMTSTPDGKILALAAFSGEIEVFQVSSHRLLLHEPPAITGPQMVGRMGVWLSSDGRLVARGLTTEDSQGAEHTTAFQIWDTATGKALLADAPTQRSPWPPIDAVGLAPDGRTLIAFEEADPATTGWYLLSPQRAGYRVIASASSYRQTPQTITYSPSTGKWLLDIGDGYATWTPPALPSVTAVPCDIGFPSSALSGDLYACVSDRNLPGGNDIVLVWNTARKAPLAKLTDRRLAGSVRETTFFDNGHYLAFLAELTQETNDSAPKDLFTYSVSGRPAEVSVVRLPGVSAGWEMQSIGNAAVALGVSVLGGYCCVKAVAG